MDPLSKSARLSGPVLSLLLVCLSTSPVMSQYDPEGHEGTTKNIQEVFQGRCWDYEVTRYLTDLPRVKTDCAHLWNLFFESFSYQPPCDVQLESYQHFFEASRQKVPKDKTLFWSGVFHLAHLYSNYGQRFVTLEDTLTGYLANSVTWCGQVTDPGMNFTRCPAWDDCPMEASESFWAGASRAFAREASGKVLLMLDGSNPDKKAYRRDSFFGKYELPNLGKQVTSVSVLVSHVLDQPKLETCSNGSLLLLQSDVKERGLAYTCQNDPLAVMHLLCSANPMSRECQMAKFHQQGQLTYQDRPTRFNQIPDTLR